MSTKGIYTAVSGAMAQSKRVDTISNNLANVNTTGFKKSKQVFNEYLTAAEKPPDVIQVGKVPSHVDSFYDLQGSDKAYVNSAGTYTDFQQGTVKHTGNAFDFAIEGKGFFEVLTPQGVRFTRDGSFKRSVNGELVTSRGFPVLSSGVGGAPEARKIAIDTNNVSVSYSGDVYSNGQEVARLSVVSFNNKDALKPQGLNMFAINPVINSAPQESEEYQIHQGHIESSNVNVVSEMTEMISAQRVFESTQQAIKAFDAMNAKLINDVPKVGR